MAERQSYTMDQIFVVPDPDGTSIKVVAIEETGDEENPMKIVEAKDVTSAVALSVIEYVQPGYMRLVESRGKHYVISVEEYENVEYKDPKLKTHGTGKIITPQNLKEGGFGQ